ncbi:acetylornithine deacetylase [Mesorhizobium sp. VK23B]|uniref:Acetylornithine deacetylase n=1 Tax=Mesorhizobium dulcispinae TaxID=3072316 RepID=A0ABU4XA95_9HYPH|nr:MULTISPECIES: acetylornithine deacetylase [unclassified Mesorhizobium]MDX8465684.1 acetylornithine deacetylase [Mesorhizobium sp. VK23B]MDX8471514.1 acetylornithine deacetylase [Mesorhizobium sp. VK23A]
MTTNAENSEPASLATSELGGKAIDILAKLVAFPSVSSAANRDAIAYIADYFGELGASVLRLPSEQAGKENLWVTFGGSTDGGIVLSGHIDVVPVAGQDWHRPPFVLTLESDKVYGRGTTDMKGFVACVMAAASQIDSSRLKRPLHIAVTFDEEVGCHGARELVAFLKRTGTRPAAFLVGEPTGMAVVDRHKGSVGFTTEIAGKAAHSSQIHLGLNAIQVAAELVGFLMSLGEKQKGGRADEAFPYPYPSINVGSIRGGGVRNIVAPVCAIDWEVRPILPGQLNEIREAFSEHVRDKLAERQRWGGLVPEIVTQLVYDTPPLIANDPSEARNLALQVSGRNQTLAVSYGTEAGIYQEAGFATVVCGPGDIQQAHTADEWIEIDQLEQCVAFLQRLFEHCSDI